MSLPSVKSYRSIWCAVIQQMFVDATSENKDRLAINAKNRARVWLTRPSNDFIEVCHLADIEPDTVRRRARELIDGIAMRRVRPRTPKRTRIVKRFEYQGHDLTITEWGERTGILPATLRSRLRAGEPIEHAILDHKRMRGMRTPGVGHFAKENMNDRTLSAPQDRTEMEFS